MVNDGVAYEFNTPVWIDENGVEVDKSNAFGCLCTHKIIHLEMCVVADEVGSNTSQKGDGHIGGKKFLCKKGAVLYEKVSTKDKHFTVMGFTLLTGDPVMFVIIISGTDMMGEVETGIDIFSDEVGNPSDAYYLQKNSGKGK